MKKFTAISDRVFESKADDLADTRAEKEANNWWDKKEPKKSAVTKVAGKSYGGSKQTDPEEKDDKEDLDETAIGTMKKYAGIVEGIDDTLPVTEDEERGNDLLDKYLDQNKMWHFEGNTRDLGRLISTLGGYSDIDDFLRDNSGAQSAIVDWISTYIDQVPEWKENLKSATGNSGGEEIDDPMDDTNYVGHPTHY